MSVGKEMNNNDIERVICNLLNLKEDEIERIDCSNDDLYVYLAKKKDLLCPRCESDRIYSKGFYERNIVIPVNALKNYNVHLKVRRYKCQDCFDSFSDSKNLTPANKKISYRTIIDVMEMLKSPRCTFVDAAKGNGISSSSVVRIFDDHCHIVRENFPEVLCMDEVYTKNNDFDAKYSCIFYDLSPNLIIHI